MNEQYQIDDRRLCKACNKTIAFAGEYWVHLTQNGVQPLHIGEPYEAEEEKPSEEIQTGYVNFDANDFYALQDKLTAANARIADLEVQLAAQRIKQLDAILQPVQLLTEDRLLWA